MDNFKFLLQIYYKPAEAMSNIMDNGSWLFAAACVVWISIGLGFGINKQIRDVYAVSASDYYFMNGGFEEDYIDDIEARLNRTDSAPAEFVLNKRPFPAIGNAVYWLFRFDSSFITPFFVLMLFYFPGTIAIATIAGKLGNPGTVIKRDYATFTTCGLMAWTAAHLPFVIAGLALGGAGLDGSFFLSLWAASGLLFGGFLLFALRTVFGLEMVAALITVAVSWIFYCIGLIVTSMIGPWLFSPFLIIIAVLFFGGFIKGEVSGLGNAMRDKRNFKRFLHNATVNPNDADAHVQLGLIYSQRLQIEKAREHFERAFEIDNEEIDANYELGKIARQNGELQKAIEHFSVVVEQNDKYKLSEVWREIGVTYKTAGMLKEAEDALQKFVTRRSFDSEGLYHYGMLLKEKGDVENANDLFEQAVQAVKTAPYYRRKELIKWSKLAAKEIA